MKRIESDISMYFEGWYFDDAGNFRDPAGNAYRPQDFRETFWGRQLYRELAGTSLQVYSFKEELQRRVDHPQTARERCMSAIHGKGG